MVRTIVVVRQGQSVPGQAVSTSRCQSRLIPLVLEASGSIKTKAARPAIESLIPSVAALLSPVVTAERSATNYGPASRAR